MPAGHKWGGVYAEENAFAICPNMRWPPWLHMIPDTGKARVRQAIRERLSIEKDPSAHPASELKNAALAELPIWEVATLWGELQVVQLAAKFQQIPHEANSEPTTATM